MTIQANELRIGNTIQWLHEEHETFHNVDIEIISVIERYNKNPNDDIFSRGFWYAPIPLTPKVLLKCRFEKVDHIHGYSFWTAGNKTAYRSLSIYENKTEWKGYTIKHITSLHQLQNAIFILTGTELNYQP